MQRLFIRDARVGWLAGLAASAVTLLQWIRNVWNPAQRTPTVQRGRFLYGAIDGARGGIWGRSRSRIATDVFRQGERSRALAARQVLLVPLARHHMPLPRETGIKPGTCKRPSLASWRARQREEHKRARLLGCVPARPDPRSWVTLTHRQVLVKREPSRS